MSMIDECNITCVRFPGAWFNNLAAIKEFEPDCARIEDVLTTYSVDRDETTTRHELNALGLEPDDIESYLINSGKRIPRIYFSCRM